MNNQRSSLFVVSLTVLCAILLNQSESLATSRCPPVKPRNAAERDMIEASSDKNGCWVRQKNGKLVFVSQLPPNENYKPLMNPAAVPECKPSLGSNSLVGALSSPLIDLAGTWKVKSGVWPGQGELALIRAAGKPGDIQIIDGCEVTDVSESTVTLSREPGGRYCMSAGGKEACILKTGPTTYSATSSADHGVTTHCKYVLDGNTFRGECTDSNDSVRKDLYIGKRLSLP